MVINQEDGIPKPEADQDKMEEDEPEDTPEKTFEDYNPAFKELSEPALAFLRQQTTAKEVSERF